MDFITDQSCRHLLHIDSLLEVPEYVKTSSCDPEDIETLVPKQFADTQHTEFPIDTPGHTYLSYGYYKSAGARNEDILKRINQAAKAHGIQADLLTLDERLASTVKRASSVKKAFAVELDYGAGDPEGEGLVKQGGVHGFYPINNEFEVENSATAILEHKHRIPLDVFVAGCREIVKAASVHNVKLHKTVLNYGIEKFPNYDYVKWAASARTRDTGDPVYVEIAECAETDAETPTEQFIELWQTADDQNNVQYSEFRPDPWDIFNSGMSKAAVEAKTQQWAVLADVPVPVDSVRQFPEAQLDKYFSKESAAKLKEIVKQAATQDGPDLTNSLSSVEPTIQKSFLKLLAA